MQADKKLQRLLHRLSLMLLFSITARAQKAVRDDVIRNACLKFGYSSVSSALSARLHYLMVNKIIEGER